MAVPKVLFTLKGHSERVNGVMWLGAHILVSISADKSLIIWSFENENPKNPLNWTLKRTFANAHTEAINYLRTYNPPQS